MKRDHRIFPFLRVRLPLVLAGLILILPVLSGFVAADTVTAGIQAGAASQCPSGCSCMPVSQAEKLGFVPCSDNQAPCFLDSLDRPLYCYKPSSALCVSGCNVTAEFPVQTTTLPGRQNSTLNITGDRSDTVYGGTNAPSQAPDIFTVLAAFFRSLFGMH
jgi:hypothetical protein